MHKSPNPKMNIAAMKDQKKRSFHNQRDASLMRTLVKRKRAAENLISGVAIECSASAIMPEEPSSPPPPVSESRLRRWQRAHHYGQHQRVLRL